MDLTAAAHSTLPPGEAPEWIQLLPAGTFRGVDGRGPYRVAAPQAVIEASLSAGKLPIDENHATEHAAKTGAASPARGWIVGMEARPDGVWGRVEWNPTGVQLMAEKAYRGISPVFYHLPNGNVLRIASAALTNKPNLPIASMHAALSDHERDALPDDLFAFPATRQDPLRDPAHVQLAWDMVDRTQGVTLAERRAARRRILARARQLGMDTRDWDTAASAAHTAGEDMDPTAIRAALGLPETATEADILARVTANAASASAHTQAVTAIAAAAGVTAANQAELLIALQAQRAGAGADGDLSRTVVALQTQLQTLQQAGARDRAAAFIDGAIRDGKPIVPLRDRLIARHMATPEDVEAEVNALPSINVGGIVRAQHATEGRDGDPLTPGDRRIARLMNLDPNALAKHRRARRLAAADEGEG